MKTNDLIALLATSAGPAPRAVAARRFAPAMAAGLLASVAAAVFVLGLVPAELFRNPMWWAKLSYVLLLAAAAAWLASRLARPAARSRAGWGMVAAVVLGMSALGLFQVWRSDPTDRMALWMGHSWRSCPLTVLVLSLPGLALALWALRGLAPTRPRLAGFAAGLLAGAVGAAGYALACDELSMAFVATWYSLGILLTAVLGALLGPRLLRW